MESSRTAASAQDNISNLMPILRSRVGGRSINNKTILPLTHSNINNRTSPSHTSNNFLLGGMYVPNKDKKRRVQRRSRSDHVYRFRVAAEIVDLWQRLWFTSPVVAIIIGLLLSYVLFFYIVVPIVAAIFNHEGYTLHHHNRGIDWLLTDTALFDLLPSAKEERGRAERFAMERERVRKQEGETRLEVLAALVPGWFHRNDPKKAEEITTAAAHTTKSEPKEEKDSTEKNKNVTVTESRTKPDLPDPVKAVPSSVEKSQSDGDRHAQRRPLRTLQTMDMLSNNSRCPSNLSDTDLDVTLVVQSSLDRVWILDETCARWKAPIVLVVAIKAEEKRNVAHDLVGWGDKCPQMNLIIHYMDEKTEGTPEHYPVNALRNMALDAVQTSHILVVDVDFVPSANLEKTIRSTLLNAHSNTEKEAIVVPAFQRVLSPPCTTDEQCKRHLRLDSSFIPHSFEDLRRCHDAKDCIIFQNDINGPGHSSTRSHEWLDRKWYEESVDENGSRRIRSITCFDSLRYEPYVVIRWCPTGARAAAQKKLRQLDYENASTTQNNHSNDLELAARPVAPYYDERFHGYGKNKIQHISHLRLLGYKFAVLPEGFIVHNPHIESAVKETWNNVEQSKLHQDMDVLYRNFLHELFDKYFDQFGADIVDQCSRER